MIKNNTYNILIIAKPEEKVFNLNYYLDKSIIITNVTSVFSNTDAIKELKNQQYHIIFLDLGKPGRTATSKIDEVLSFAHTIPTVILSNKLDLTFSISCLEKGASDYLIKDSLNTFTVYKAIKHNVDRRNHICALEEAKMRYRRLFHLSPQPMWVYDIQTLKFLDVNEAALIKYGYSFNEFLCLEISDIRPEEEIPKSFKTIYETRKKITSNFKGFSRHRTKDNKILDVEIHSNRIKFNKKSAQLILANDITKKLKHIKAIESQNRKLREIAWTQSHVVRAPLVRIMALVNMLNENCEEHTEFYLEQISKSAQEFDKIIHEISEKTDQMELED